VPEERHLFLQRPLGVDHAEQPSLSRVRDVGRRVERADHRQPGKPRLADVLVDAVKNGVVVDEPIERRCVAELRECIDFSLRCAETNAAEEVLDQ